MREQPGERPRANRTVVDSCEVIQFSTDTLPHGIANLRECAAAYLHNWGDSTTKRYLEALAEALPSDVFLDAGRRLEARAVWRVRNGNLKALGTMDWRETHYIGRMASRCYSKVFDYNRIPSPRLQRPATGWVGKRYRNRWLVELRLAPGSAWRIPSGPAANDMAVAK